MNTRENPEYLVPAWDAFEAIVGSENRRALFWRARYLADSTFLAHLPFAFWLFELCRPRIIVSAGSADPVPYFSFCQAVERLDIPAQCIAICTPGDEADCGPQAQTGPLAEHNAEHYPDFSTVIYGTPLNQAGRFRTNSIDLLHIGPEFNHDLLAIQRDWWARLSDRGLVLLHDTERLARSDAGHAALAWLDANHPTIRFNHGHGLVLALVGKTPPRRIALLAEDDVGELWPSQMRLAFSRLGAGHVHEWESRKYGAAAECRQREARSAEGKLVETERALADTDKRLETLRSACGERTRLVGELQAEVSQLELEQEEATETTELLKQSLGLARSEAELLRRQLQAVQGQLGNLCAERDELQAAKRHAQETEQRLRGELHEARGSLDSRFDEIARLTDLIERNDKRAQATADALERMLEAKRKAAEQLKDQMMRRERTLLVLQSARLRLVKALSKSFRSSPVRSRLLKQEKLLKDSCLFDAKWYLDSHPDVCDAGLSAEMHFLMHGTYEGRDPSVQFSTMDYYLANPDVAEQGGCAVLHFILYGKREGRALRPF